MFIFFKIKILIEQFNNYNIRCLESHFNLISVIYETFVFTSLKIAISIQNLFEENVEILSYPCLRHRLRRRRRAKTLTFSNLSVITEDIYT